MHNTDEGIKIQATKERNSVIIMSLFLAALAAVVWGTLTYGNFSNLYYVIYVGLLVLGVAVSKIYLFFVPRRRYGVVKNITNISDAYMPGNKNGGTSVINGFLWERITMCTVVVDFDNGKNGSFDCVYKGDLKLLKAGDRVGIYRFLKMPVWENKNA